MFLSEEKNKKIFYFLFYAVLTVLAIYLFFKYVLKCIIPFVIAFLLAFITRKPVNFLCNKFKFKKTFAVFAVNASVVGLIFSLLYYICGKILSELGVLITHITPERIEGFSNRISLGIFNFTNSFLPSFSQSINYWVSVFLKNFDTFATNTAKNMLPYLADTLINIFSKLPGVFLFTGVTLISFFYISNDYKTVTRFFTSQFSSKHLKFLSEIKEQFLTTVFGILRAYFILMLMTFLECLAGFSVLGIQYATLLAFITALIDILPILGAGTILIPWGITNLVLGNYRLGLSIISLYVIIIVIRQFAEPKILGGFVGLHPLATIISMYFGIKLAGISGLFLFPLAVVIIKNLNESGSIHLYKNLTPDNSEAKTLARKKLKSLSETNFFVDK